MKSYTVKRQIRDQINWSLIPIIEIESWIEKPQLPVQATAQLCWSDTHLHVYMTAREPDILARYQDDWSPVCRDSCLEMFFCPIAEDSRYFNIELNPNGACFFGFGHGREDLIRLHPWNVRELLNIRTMVDGDFWSVQYDVPEKTLQMFFPSFTFESGHRMRANFYKCGDDIQPTHELIWNPITNGNSDFHQPAFFGDLILE